MIKLNAKQLRSSIPNQRQLKKIKKNPIALVLDNITDTYNIGSFFRLADALGAQKLYLCGRVVTPPNVKIQRASVGTWRWVDWEGRRSTTETIKSLKKEGWQVVSVEQNPKSKAYWQIKPKFPLALVLGNESRGISKKVINLSDAVAELPMWGVNRSLNVFAAGAAISYFFSLHLHSPSGPV